MLMTIDLKPANVVIIQSTRPQLHIIDYSVSVFVDDPDSWIEGYRGTPGWVAPEVGDEDGPPRKYQPTRADLWPTGNLSQYLTYHLSGWMDGRLESLVDTLIGPAPSQRPLISSIDLAGRL